MDGIVAQFLPSLVGGLAVGGSCLLLTKKFGEWLRSHLKPYLLLIDVAADRLVFVFMASYVAVLGTMSVLRHDSFHSNAYDLGIFDQVVWNLANGHWFDETVMIEYTRTLLGNHFSPVFFLFAPLYWVIPDARVLLIVQTIALAAGALPVYWLARDKLHSRPAALALTSSYFLYPALHYVNLFDFHEIAIASPFLGFAIYFLVKQRYRLFAVCLFFALISREEIAIVAVGLGLWIFFLQRKRWIGAAVVAVSAVWGYATIMVIIPHFQGANDYYYVVRYAHLGRSTWEIISTIVSDPLYVLGMLSSPPRVEYILQLFVPLGFLPALGLDLLVLSIPSFSYLLLSNYREMYDIGNQYSAVLIPPIFLALVQGVSILVRKQRSPNNPYLWAAVSYVLVSSSVSYYLYSPGPLAQRFRPERYTVDDHVKLGQDIINNKIPAIASVSAQSDLVPHLAHRAEIYMFPYLHNADYILLDKQSRPWPLRKGQYDAALEDLRTNPAYRLAMDEDGYLLYEKKPDPLPYTYFGGKFGNYLEAVGYELSQPNSHVGGSIDLAVYWKVPDDLPDDERLPRLDTVVELVDESGTVVSGQRKEPGDGALQTDHWATGDLVRERYTIPVPRNVEPGSYIISLGIRNAKGGPNSPSISYSTDLTTVKIR